MFTGTYSDCARLLTRFFMHDDRRSGEFPTGRIVRVTTAKDSGLPAPLDALAPSACDLDARTRDWLVVLLSVLSGATDATGFLAFGHAFTSVMTGNMVLVGIAVGTRDGSAIGLIMTAIVSYVAGVAAGSRVAGQPQDGDGPWPPAVTRALTLELALLAGYAVVWWSLDSHPSHGWFALLLAFNAAALGVQSSAILRFGTSGLSTTYLTGTLITVVSRLAARQSLHTVNHPARILAGLVLGAAGGAALVTRAHPVAPALPLGLLLIVLVTVTLCQRSRALPGRDVAVHRPCCLEEHIELAGEPDCELVISFAKVEVEQSRGPVQPVQHGVPVDVQCAAAALMLPPDWI
jgi:uncharacterized membrane protein YoaK (UPF0700 family)